MMKELDDQFRRPRTHTKATLLSIPSCLKELFNFINFPEMSFQVLSRADGNWPVSRHIITQSKALKKKKKKVKLLSCVWLFAAPWTIYSLPGSSIQTRMLEWVAISFPRGTSWTRDQTQVSRIPGSHQGIPKREKGLHKFPGFIEKSRGLFFRGLNNSISW